jgi:hypothetical protein
MTRRILAIMKLSPKRDSSTSHRSRSSLNGENDPMADARGDSEAPWLLPEEQAELSVASRETAPAEEDLRGLAERLREMRRFGAALERGAS